MFKAADMEICISETINRGETKCESVEWSEILRRWYTTFIAGVESHQGTQLNILYEYIKCTYEFRSNAGAWKGISVKMNLIEFKEV